jgi:O-antigen/teichoic acid export membrane protein
MSVHRRRLGAGIAIYLVRDQFLTSVVLARWFITPAELGLFSIAFAAVTIVAFLQDFGVTRYVNGERDLTPEKLHMAFTVSVAFAWGIAILTILSAKPIALFYGDPRLLPITLVIACSIWRCRSPSCRRRPASGAWTTSPTR